MKTRASVEGGSKVGTGFWGGHDWQFQQHLADPFSQEELLLRVKFIKSKRCSSKGEGREACGSLF